MLASLKFCGISSVLAHFGVRGAQKKLLGLAQTRDILKKAQNSSAIFCKNHNFSLFHPPFVPLKTRAKKPACN